MANETLNEKAPAAAENREPTTASPARSPAAATSAKSAPAGRTPAAAKTRPRPAAKRGRAPAKRATASGRRSLKQASIAPALERTPAERPGFGGTVADLVESTTRPYASAQEQLASATRGTWIAPVAELNARAITQVAAAQASLARRLLG
jgi:hypothetical protein